MLGRALAIGLIAEGGADPLIGVALVFGNLLSAVLRWLYGHALCGHCREVAVVKLAGWGLLDEDRRAECRDDAFEDVRKAAGW